MQSGGGAGAGGDHIGDQQSGRRFERQAAGQLGRQGLCHEAEPRAAHSAVLDQLGSDRSRHVGGDGERETRDLECEDRVDADDLTVEVHQRAAGAAQAQDRGRLEVVGSEGPGALATARADDAGGHRRPQPLRRADRHDPVAHAGAIGVRQPREGERREFRRRS